MSLSLTHERSRLRGDDEVKEAATESYIVIIRMRPEKTWEKGGKNKQGGETLNA